jgi:hypothetical protein
LSDISPTHENYLENGVKVDSSYGSGPFDRRATAATSPASIRVNGSRRSHVLRRKSTKASARVREWLGNGFVCGSNCKKAKREECHDRGVTGKMNQQKNEDGKERERDIRVHVIRLDNMVEEKRRLRNEISPKRY